jgi:amino acid efflux transporter
MSTNTEKIGLATATIIGMNAMIGSGIFTAPAALAANVGPAGILAYLFVIIAALFMALSLARLAQLYPEEGSFYTYAKQWGGHTIGMIAIGSYFIGLVIAMGLLAQMAGSYLHHFFPSLSPQLLATSTLVILTLLNMFGMALSELGQKILICTTIFPLIAITILCFFKGSLSNLTPFAPHGFGNVLKATRMVIFGFFGFECATSLFNIVKKPEKNVPRALTLSILIVGTIYLLFVAAIIYSVPLHLFVDPRMPLSDVLSVVFPTIPWLITLIHCAILSAIIGTIHSMIWASSNLLTLIVTQFKNATIKKIGSLITPKIAVLMVGAAILTSNMLLHNLNLFFYITAIFIVISFVLSLITLLTLKKEWKSGQNIQTIIGIATAALIFAFAVEGLLQELHLLG